MNVQTGLTRWFFERVCLLLAALGPALLGTPALASESGRGFTPPPEESIPSGGFGDLIRNGEKIFTHTGEFAGRYTGNKLTCESCHLDRGRKAYSAPLWGAYVMYPRYRKKNHKVNSLAERIQGCFRFSMNGKAPPVDGRTIKSLIAYSFWMSRGAPVGMTLKGSRMVTLPEPAKTPDPIRGKKVYVARCALCHGLHGQGRVSRGEIAFPPVWGAASYNKGAGFYKVAKLAGFIKMNMPLSKGTSLPEQMAWDVAAYIDSQPRPDKPLSK